MRPSGQLSITYQQVYVSSPMLAVSLFCKYLCSGGGGGRASQKSLNQSMPMLRYNQNSYILRLCLFLLLWIRQWVTYFENSILDKMDL